MSTARRIVLFIAAFGLVTGVIAPTASAHDRRGPVVTQLASFGNGGSVTGSTIGPDGALYVTDGNAGSVLRIDRRSGRVTTYATGLPRKALPPGAIGGPVDIAFVGRTAYVLVTLVSGKLAGAPFGNSADKNGIYRLERNGGFRVVADIGKWSVDNPPAPAFFIDTGVQYAMEPYHGGFLVTDGHHNRVLHVTRHGGISEVATFGNVVPTGLEVTNSRVFITLAGPNPHRPEDGKVLALRRGSPPREVASGASLLIDVERGPGGRLYALSQGQWDGVGEGSPALPNTGRLVVVQDDGSLAPVVDRHGRELVLDRPTSMEFVGDTAYVVSVVGGVYKIDNL
ncbi:ScyD/ScyE family protein [Kribbella sp. CA-245084]|uniref:ScyD/ScyE family protein n=1 Tax=Kribbella sp. CA-245084 TaxID=3239940 RepID=UPI003D8B35BE